MAQSTVNRRLGEESTGGSLAHRNQTSSVQDALPVTSLRNSEFHDDHADVSDDDDEYRISDEVQKPGKISLRRQADVAAFDAWVDEHQRDISTESSGSKIKNGLSASNQTASSIANRIISSPREYQIELFERAKSRNTVVVLDTGL